MYENLHILPIQLCQAAYFRRWKSCRKKNVFSLLLQVIEASQRNKHTGVKGSRDGSMEGKRQKNIVVSKLKP